MSTTPATPTRLFALDGSFNFRDLGGYETSDGHTVRWRRLFRADGPHALSAADAVVLGDLGLATVIDLRTADEAEQRGRWQDHLGTVDYRHLPMMDVLPEEEEFVRTWSDAVNVGERYGHIARAGASAVGAALTCLAQSDALPAVFHCSAGKDRTGVLAAIVLGLLGVPDETIVTDYALSADAMARMLDWLRTQATDLEQLDRYAPAVRSAEPEAMRVFVRGVREQWASFEGYAAALGLDDEVEALRGALLE